MEDGKASGRRKLPEKLTDLPWGRINVGLHILWFLLIVLLFNLGGGKRNYDSISVSITILEILLIVAALGGFWILRPEIKETAQAEAQKHAVQAARSAAEDWLSARYNSAPPEELQKMVDVLDDKDDGGGSDGK